MQGISCIAEDLLASVDDGVIHVYMYVRYVCICIYTHTYVYTHKHTQNIHIYICNSMEQSPSSEAIQLFTKFPAFYGTRKFITVFTSDRIHIYTHTRVHIYLAYMIMQHFNDY